MPARSGPSRIILTLRSLLVMGALGATLILYNVITLRRDTNLALGPQSVQQEEFFVSASDRPDIKIFFRKLSDSQKVRMAKNIGFYTDAPLAKLCAILLGDFSPDARAVLTDSLTKIGKVRPEAVAKQLGQSGSFEQFGIRQALKALGSSVLPDVVSLLGEDPIRPNAEELLVTEGPQSAPLLIPLLDSNVAKIQTAAVDVLGKLRSTEATSKITALYESAPVDKRPPYLIALASIGSPSSESLLLKTLADPATGPYLRAQAAFGLGRIASPTAVATLWKFASSLDSTVSQGCISALVLCKDLALAKLGETEEMRLNVASGIKSAAADQVIAQDLNLPDLQLIAANAASGRPGLTPALQAFLIGPKNESNGVLADAAIKSLMTTTEGKAVLTKLSSRPLLSGLIQRRQVMGTG